jgi:DNA polymerase-3 subunit epsilon
MNPKRDRVIEIGILRVENGKVVDSLDTVVQPHLRIPPEIQSLTGIKNDEVARAPDFDEIRFQIEQIFDGAVLVAHNARFDYAFLKHEFGRNGDDFRAKILCTVRLTRKLFPGLSGYSLESLINYFGIKVGTRHRAYADAEVLWKLYSISLENHGELKVLEAVNSILKSASLPNKLPKKMVDELPDTPGIYMFFSDDNKLPLYVGKSINIKDRVKGHFSSDHANTKDLTMSSQISRVETIETAGELGALIREADYVKALMPVYNRQLRRRQDLIVAFLDSESEYKKVKIINLQEVGKEDVGKVMAVYKSSKAAKESLQKLCKEYNLCPKFLGIEKGKGRCFGSQIGICYGACVCEEKAEDYNSRFRDAFHKSRVSKWPYKSAVVIKEENINGLTELHLIDNWMYLGSVLSNELLDEPKVEKYSPRFDWDIYKILARAIRKNKSVKLASPEEEAIFT